MMDFFSFPSWEDAFLAACVAAFALLAGAGVLAAWFNRRSD